MIRDDLGACILVCDAASGPGPLQGWRIGVKDNMDVAGTVRTDGLPPPHPPPARKDSEAVRRLRAAGASVVAKTNLEELSFGATTQNSWWGRCRNPWDPSRLPGGSSGGSAVAVAAGMVDAALGTDTGGSVRNPAALCGISALRPTVGLIPMDGVTPLSPEFDVVGPMARTVEELRALFAALTTPSSTPRAEHAPLAPAGQLTPARPLRPPDPLRPTRPEPLPALRVGIPGSFFFDDLHPSVAAGCDEMMAALREAGAFLRPIALRGAERTPEALAILLNSQAAEIHAAVLHDERVDEQVRDRLALGRRATRAHREAARAVADRWRREVADVFQRVDVLFVPTTPMPAPPIDGTHMVEISARINRCNAAWSLARLPALTIPSASDGLPVGVQFAGPPGGDRRLLDVGAAIQRRTDWHERRPPGIMDSIGR